ncbi:MAG: lipopolysaccharide heptosyltransferase I [Pyrinomonadaceae bacterium]
MKVLIVRLTSMGDVVQTLPAISDAARAFPGISFDWVVDEDFADIPAWHTSVENVIPSALRRWRREAANALRSGEIGSLLKKIRAHRYDAVVDLQGEMKSAMITRLAKGLRMGHDRRSVHEWGAHIVYKHRLHVPKGQHSILRMRRLLADALNYSFDENAVDYGIDRSRLLHPGLELPERFVVFIHSTSWKSKNWPEHYWRDLTLLASASGLKVLLPWGSADERERSERIAGPEGIVLPDLSIAQKASIIARADAVVGLDTGLSHIAAALDIPGISLYGATDPLLVGATGKNQINIASGFKCVRCHQTTCTFPEPSNFKPACFVEITPERVWAHLESLSDYFVHSSAM